MLSRPTVLALVAAGCMVAAGVGSYIAVRQNSGGLSAGRLGDPLVAPVPEAVAETEAVVAGDVDLPVPAPPDVKPADERVAPRAPASSRRASAPTAAESRSSRAEARPAKASEPEVRGLERPWPSRAREAERPEVDIEPGAPEDVGQPVGLSPYVPPQPMYEELVVSADSVLGLQIENAVSTETARLEDTVDARVTRDVFVGGMLAIPSGTRVVGAVTLVEQGGKIKERARLGVRFHTLVLADATRVPIQTDPIYREGDPPSNKSAAKIGGAAIGGAILGAILGGSKGAVIGGSAGAAGGTAAVMAGGREPATLAAGAPVTVRLTSPVTVTVER